MAEYPLQKIKLSDSKVERIEGDTYRIAGKIAANCVDMADKVIVEAIIAMCKDEGVTELYLLDKKFLLNAIEKALHPTADVVEVKHGYWEQKFGDFDYCSVCHNCVEYGQFKYYYCPHCGAKMDGKDINVPAIDGEGSEN